ncbi:glycosyltransferase [Deinococcus fonticola]|uniref:glycosyltransferase n=1 Tax=Deinococcus fonticola TaxID=2528713 RepID=UPI001074D211|nr:glycosyltransferase [Deinococcus fonticola]
MPHPFFSRVASVLPWALLGAKLGTLALNAALFPRLRPAPPAPHHRRDLQAARTSILMPARNEAHNLPHSLPGLLSQGAAEVLVLDDHSQDGTAELARALGAMVLSGQPLPPGWAGKNWACHQLAGAARGDLLLFVDADVQWQPGTLDALLHQLDASGADLLSIFPRQANVTWGERLLTPVIDDVLLSGLPAPLLKIPSPLASAANGQTMLFRREAYRASGGHAGVRAELLEDVQLSRRVKASGGRVALALGGDLIGVRMYRAYPESVRGLSKSMLRFYQGSRPLLLLSWALFFLTYTRPLFKGQRALLLLGLLEGGLVRVVTGRTRPRDLLEVLLAPLLPLLALPVYARALQREVEWKGRTYRQDTSR